MFTSVPATVAIIGHDKQKVNTFFRFFSKKFSRRFFEVFSQKVLTFLSILGILNKHSKLRGIAQLVEQRSPKPRAEGSIPSAPATFITDFLF